MEVVCHSETFVSNWLQKCGLTQRNTTRMRMDISFRTSYEKALMNNKQLNRYRRKKENRHTHKLKKHTMVLNEVWNYNLPQENRDKSGSKGFEYLDS
jgi:hypothetical protein